MRPELEDALRAAPEVAQAQRRARSCGECTYCCTAVAVHERGTRADGTPYAFSKPAFEPCKHACASGCAVYSKPEKPYSCRSFRCAWLQGCGPEEARPDKLSAVVSWGDLGTSPFTGQVVPAIAVHKDDSTPFFGNPPLLETLWDLAQKHPVLKAGVINVITPAGNSLPEGDATMAVDFATGASRPVLYRIKDKDTDPETFPDPRADLVRMGFTDAEIESENFDFVGRLVQQAARETRTERRARQRRATKLERKTARREAAAAVEPKPASEDAA